MRTSTEPVPSVIWNVMLVDDGVAFSTWPTNVIWCSSLPSMRNVSSLCACTACESCATVTGVKVCTVVLGFAPPLPGDESPCCGLDEKPPPPCDTKPPPPPP